MIPAHGWFATFESDTHTRITPVVAWGENGKPMVYDPDRGSLWTAQKLPGFVELWHDEESRTQRKRRHAS